MAKLYYRRSLEVLNERLNERDPLIQTFIGPRQVGKTTFLTEFLPKKKTIYVTADDAVGAPPTWIEEQWQNAIRTNGVGSVLVIDEIQKVENWANVIKQLWDRSVRDKKRLKLVLSGSSSLELHTGMNDSLTGRFELIHVPHWSFTEMREAFGVKLDEYLENGGYPAYPRMRKALDRWKHYFENSIINTVIEKDILKFEKVKSEALFKQCFVIACHHPAQVLSYQKFLGQLQTGGNIDIVKRYLELYEAAFLIRQVYKWSGSAVVRTSSSPKLIPMAPVMSHLLGAAPLGRRFEAQVGADLLRHQIPVWYWQEGNFEVDFVVQIKKELIAIEVKSGRPKHAKSLEVFRKKYPKSRVLFITLDNYEDFSLDPAHFISEYAL